MASGLPQACLSMRNLSLDCCETEKHNESEKHCSLLRMIPINIFVGYYGYSEEVRDAFLLGKNWRHG